MKLLEAVLQNQYPSIFLGSYYIPNGGKPIDTYVRTPIEWLVLEVDEKNKRALLLSKYVLDWEGFADCPIIGHGYNTSWYDSYLRKWLNEDFYRSSFTPEESSKIFTVYNAASPGNGKRAIDKIFLLSVEEVKKYFKTEDSAITVQPMIECSASGDKDDPIIIDHEPVAWWTRTTGSTKDLVMCVYFNGKIVEMDSNSDETGVRPAMWINL